MKHLHKLFVILAFIGFAGMFFLAGASDAGKLSINQLICLCAASAAAMGIGLIGDLLIVEVHIK